MKFALLKNFSFNPFVDADIPYLFDDSNYKNYLEDKIEFVNFDNITDLINSISIIINNNIEIFNAYYDDKYLIQSFYYDDPESSMFEKMVFVKRKIQKDDSYTYIGHEYDDDFYEFLDVTIDDLVKIFKNKYIINGVKIMATGQIYNIQYIKNKTNSKYCEILHFNGIPSLKYLDISHIVNTYSDDKINDKITKYTAKYSSEYIYIQKHIDFCILDMYSESSGIVKNEIASLLISDTIYGDVIINCQNILNEDKRILYTDKDLIINIINVIKSKSLKIKNNNIFNIYYELL